MSWINFVCTRAWFAATIWIV